MIDARTAQRLRRDARSQVHNEDLSAQRIDIPQADGHGLTTWLHQPGVSNAPILFELHGGGFALGDARRTDALRKRICEVYGVAVVGVEYRLAPEHPFPAALNDVRNAVAWYAQHAGAFGCDPQQIYLMGYSAGGGNLAAACALLLNRKGGPTLSGVILHYPALDLGKRHDPALNRNVDLPGDLMSAYTAWYLDGADANDPLASPLCATDDELQRFPPWAILPVVGDALHDEAAGFAARLSGVRVPGALVEVDEAYHGYIEDAANLDVYRALTMPQVIEQRPHNFVECAEWALHKGLSCFFKPRSSSDTINLLPTERHTIG